VRPTGDRVGARFGCVVVGNNNNTTNTTHTTQTTNAPAHQIGRKGIRFTFLSQDVEKLCGNHVVGGGLPPPPRNRKLSGNTIELGDVGGEPGKELSFLFNSQVCLVGGHVTQQTQNNRTKKGSLLPFGLVVVVSVVCCLLPHEQTTPETGQRVMMGCFPVAGKAPHSTLRCRVPLRRPLKIRERASTHLRFVVRLAFLTPVRTHKRL
jgi:hypothetical protein